MKIRNGFVSNSSSSSFCILGISVDDATYDKVQESDKCGIITECGINEGDDSKYIGLNPESMKEEETLSQFKDRIISEASKIGIVIEKAKLDWITDGGYNG